jgi:hypothetical protein
MRSPLTALTNVMSDQPIALMLAALTLTLSGMLRP